MFEAGFGPTIPNEGHGELCMGMPVMLSQGEWEAEQSHGSGKPCSKVLLLFVEGVLVQGRVATFCFVWSGVDVYTDSFVYAGGWWSD